MRKLTLAIALAGFAASAAQAVTVTSAFGAPDPGKGANETYVVTFDAPNAPGYVFGPGLSTAPNSIPGAAQPAGNADIFGFVTSSKNPNFVTLSTPDLQSISFYWGSIDAYNYVDILGPGNSLLLSNFSGSMIPPANGNQSANVTNRRVTFTADAGETITGITFRSTGVAFEFDDIATQSAVPEPATWAMLIAGFGLVGAAMRRQRLSPVRVSA